MRNIDIWYKCAEKLEVITINSKVLNFIDNKTNELEHEETSGEN